MFDTQEQLTLIAKTTGTSTLFTYYFKMNRARLLNLLLNTRCVVTVYETSYKDLNNQTRYKPSWVNKDNKTYDFQENNMLDQLWDHLCQAMNMAVDTYDKLRLNDNTLSDLLIPITFAQGIITSEDKPITIIPSMDAILPSVNQDKYPNYHLPLITNEEKIQLELKQLIPICAYRLHDMQYSGYDLMDQLNKGEKLLKLCDGVTHHIALACGGDSHFSDSLYKNYNNIDLFIKNHIEYC